MYLNPDVAQARREGNTAYLSASGKKGAKKKKQNLEDSRRRNTRRLILGSYQHARQANENICPVDD